MVRWIRTSRLSRNNSFTRAAGGAAGHDLASREVYLSVEEPTAPADPSEDAGPPRAAARDAGPPRAAAPESATRDASGGTVQVSPPSADPLRVDMESREVRLEVGGGA